MSVDVERKIKDLLNQSKPKTKTQKRNTILYLLAVPAALIITFQTLSISADQPEPVQQQIIHYYPVPTIKQVVQPANYPPQDLEFNCFGCAHFKRTGSNNELNTI